jgi:hypothetical protein
MPTKTRPVKLLLIFGSKLDFLDEWGHRLNLPKFIQYPICDAWDWHLGVFDEDTPDDWDDYHAEADSGSDCKD